MNFDYIVGKKVRIIRQVEGRSLFFTGIINSHDNDSINFTDKFGTDYIFLTNSIISIEVLKE